jgi:hypothetical protein
MGSGSDVKENQFVAFRAYHDALRNPMRLMRDGYDFYLDGKWEVARVIIESDEELRKYLNLLGSGRLMADVTKNEEAWPGSFKPIKVAQEQTMKVDGLFDWERQTLVSHPRNPKKQRTDSPVESKREKKKEKKSLGQAANHYQGEMLHMGLGFGVVWTVSSHSKE